MYSYLDFNCTRKSPWNSVYKIASFDEIDISQFSSSLFFVVVSSLIIPLYCMNVFDGLTVMISACHERYRGRPGFDSPSESETKPILLPPQLMFSLMQCCCKFLLCLFCFLGKVKLSHNLYPPVYHISYLLQSIMDHIPHI